MRCPTSAHDHTIAPTQNRVPYTPKNRFSWNTTSDAFEMREQITKKNNSSE